MKSEIMRNSLRGIFGSFGKASLSACLKYAGCAVLLSATVRGTVPDFGASIVYTNQYDLSVIGAPTVAKAKEQFADIIDRFAPPVGVPRTLVTAVSLGSDLMNYNTTAGSNFGWRALTPTQIHLSSSPCSFFSLQQYALNAKRLMVTPDPEEALDPIRVLGEAAKEAGMYHFLLFPMNDAHYDQDGANAILAGQFRAESFASDGDSNPDTSDILIDYSATGPNRYYDYTNADVRTNRLNLIVEMIDRYQDVIDGVRLDFQRFPVLFQALAPTADPSVHPDCALMTNFIKDVRARLKHWHDINGHDYYLSVRVPPSIRDCNWVGIDIADWIDEQIVDVVVPSMIYYTDHAVNLEPFVALAQPKGIKVYGQVMWTGAKYAGSRPLVVSPSAYTDVELPYATTEDMRGAMVNARARGADGIELYNFLLNGSHATEALAALAEVEGSQYRTNKTFASTPGLELNGRDTKQNWSYAKGTGIKTSRVWLLDTGTLSFDTGNYKTRTFPLYVYEPGTDLAAASHLALRLGLLGFASTDEIKVELGTTTVYEGPLSGAPAPYNTATYLANVTPAPQAQEDPDDTIKPGVEYNVPEKDHYLQMPVSATDLTTGLNNVTVTLKVKASDTNERHVTEIKLGVFY